MAKPKLTAHRLRYLIKDARYTARLYQKLTPNEWGARLIPHPNGNFKLEFLDGLIEAAEAMELALQHLKDATDG